MDGSKRSGSPEISSLSASSSGTDLSLADLRTDTTGAGGSPLPGWVLSLLRTSFFDKCSKHHERRNELNLFCAETQEKLCQHCVHERSHRMTLIHINRYMYHDTAHVKELQEFVDIQGIQSYMNNGNRVLYLDRRAQLKSKLAAYATACVVCHRMLQDGFRFCSVWCRLVERPNAYGPRPDHSSSSIVRDDSKPVRSRAGSAETPKKLSRVSSVSGSGNSSVQRKLGLGWRRSSAAARMEGGKITPATMIRSPGVIKRRKPVPMQSPLPSCHWHAA
ncbi:hypothetical protein FVE85_8448 [Porphyridium purpureum]|uniref:B box-type domain-containing protein n=1 Tax=Porphyridium purpureum TaxID=35688 RepID=A0A5J4YKM2_PORPP|nr:hypothetical protein FVE85_8448 [Porphyridium purpureum]|eukprot:POR6375..scf244_11